MQPILSSFAHALSRSGMRAGSVVSKRSASARQPPPAPRSHAFVKYVFACSLSTGIPRPSSCARAKISQPKPAPPLHALVTSSTPFFSSFSLPPLPSRYAPPIVAHDSMSPLLHLPSASSACSFIDLGGPFACAIVLQRPPHDSNVSCTSFLHASSAHFARSSSRIFVHTFLHFASLSSALLPQAAAASARAKMKICRVLVMVPGVQHRPCQAQPGESAKRASSVHPVQR